MSTIEGLSEKAASHEGIQSIWSLLGSGVSPVIRLHPRKGKDSRLMRVVDADSNSFSGTFIDGIAGAANEHIHLPYNSILHGTIEIEEVADMNE